MHPLVSTDNQYPTAQNSAPSSQAEPPFLRKETSLTSPGHDSPCFFWFPNSQSVPHPVPWLPWGTGGHLQRCPSESALTASQIDILVLCSHWAEWSREQDPNGELGRPGLHPWLLENWAIPVPSPVLMESAPDCPSHVVTLCDTPARVILSNYKVKIGPWQKGVPAWQPFLPS